MKEKEIKDSFIDRFITLNDFSGEQFIKDDYSNVNFNQNTNFVIPADRKFFSLNLITDTPQQIGVYNDNQERISGFLQIDVCEPLNSGMDEINKKKDAIYRLFKVGTTFDDVIVKGVSCTNDGAGDSYYRAIIRVEFDADIVNT